jgi:hypothetical protein
MSIKVTATYDTVEWDGEDEDPIEHGGYTDPSNPWGGFRQEMPNTPEEAGYDSWAAWSAENVDTVEFETVEEAAQFVVDFPGGVWDLRECNPETDHRTGVTMSVTLHVEETHRDAVFALAKAIQAAKDKALAELRREGSSW